MRNEEPASPIIPTSSSSFLAPAGLPVVAVKKPKEEEEPASVASSSSSSLPAATSVHVKQEETEGRAEEVGSERSIADEAPFKNDWEPGNWCWLLDDAHNWNSAPVLAVQEEEAAVKKETEEDVTEEKYAHDVVSAPQVLSSFSSSHSQAGSFRPKKEDENEEKYNTLRRDDGEETPKDIKSEHDDDVVASAAQFVACSFQAENREEKNHKLRHDDNNDEKDDDDDDDNNHTIRHRTDRIVKSNTKSDAAGSSDNIIIANNSTIGTNDPAPFDDKWRNGSWCWESPIINGGSGIVASVAAGSTGRGKKRKVSDQFRGPRYDDGIRNGETGKDQCSLNNSNQNNNHNTTNIAVTNRCFDKQHHDLFGDDWTTSCWCWDPPNTNSDSNDVALAVTAAAAAAVPPTRTGKQQKGSEQSRESRYSIPSKHQSNIGHHTTNNHTDIDEDDDQHDNHDDDDDDDDGTDSDYDSVDDDDERVSDNSGRKKRSDNKRGFLENEKRWSKMYGRLLKHKKTYKSTSIPKTNGKNARLSKWVCTQRFKYNRNALSSDRIDRLESIGFVWNLRNTYWVEMYKRLLAYKNQFESTHVPESYKADTQLVNWVYNQRSLYNSNKLSQDRINQLNSISFAWIPFDAQWTEIYDRLVKYKNEFKTTCVPSRYPDDPQLGQWVYKQRSNYNSNKPRLTVDRIAQLDSIGFVWKIKDK